MRSWRGEFITQLFILLSEVCVRYRDADFCDHSDPDLPKGGATVGASIIPDSASHKRIESWELKEGQGRGRGGRPSFERDGESVHAGSESVKAMERV